jgi:uncharacterized membrane protein YtjA (UPF0391 family)
MALCLGDFARTHVVYSAGRSTIVALVRFGTRGAFRTFRARTHNILLGEIMLQLAIACLALALIAALFGFGGLAGSMVGVAKIVFVVFLIFAVLSFVGGGLRTGRFWG